MAQALEVSAASAGASTSRIVASSAGSGFGWLGTLPEQARRVEDLGEQRREPEPWPLALASAISKIWMQQRDLVDELESRIGSLPDGAVVDLAKHGEEAAAVHSGSLQGGKQTAGTHRLSDPHPCEKSEAVEAAEAVEAVEAVEMAAALNMLVLRVPGSLGAGTLTALVRKNSHSRGAPKQKQQSAHPTTTSPSSRVW